jgi:hypothetical protein
MTGKIWWVGGLAGVLLILTRSGGWAEDIMPTDEGKGTEFKGKTFDMKDNGEVAIVLSFPAGKEFEATTKGQKETDVHLFVYDADGKEVGKDTSPGPNCSVKVTPPKEGTYKLLVKNSGGTNKVTLELKFAN